MVREEAPRQGSRDVQGMLEERQDLSCSLSKKMMRWGRVWGFPLEESKCHKENLMATS